jgi:hypothetical protein
MRTFALPAVARVSRVSHLEDLKITHVVQTVLELRQAICHVVWVVIVREDGRCNDERRL